MRMRSKTPLFLMEVTIMFLVFAISAAICLQVFANAKIISDKSSNLDRACLEAQRVAEYWQGSKGDFLETADLLKTEAMEDTLLLYFDEEWQKTTGESYFQLEMTVMGSQVKIVVSDEKESIFVLETEAVMYGE